MTFASKIMHGVAALAAVCLGGCGKMHDGGDIDSAATNLVCSAESAPLSDILENDTIAPRRAKPPGDSVAVASPPQRGASADGVRLFAEALNASEVEVCDEARCRSLAEEYLGTADFADVADMICSMVGPGSTSDDKIAAIRVLAALRHEELPTENQSEFTQSDGITDCEHGENAVDDAPAEFDDVCERATLAIMTACLSDDDATVRDAAYDALLTLPRGERTALSLQVLGNDDRDMKVALLERSSVSDDEFSLTLNFHGLDADEDSIRETAALNVMKKTGKEFNLKSSVGLLQCAA